MDAAGTWDDLATDWVLIDAELRMRNRQGLADRYVEAYSRYSWPVDSIDDLRLTPFHLLASEGRTHTDRDHVWHMGSPDSGRRRVQGLRERLSHRISGGRIDPPR